MLKATGFTLVEQYMAAGLIFSILPVLFYLVMQRYIISGLTAGAVKGLVHSGVDKPIVGQ